MESLKDVSSSEGVRGSADVSSLILNKRKLGGRPFEDGVNSLSKAMASGILVGRDIIHVRNI